MGGSEGQSTQWNQDDPKVFQKNIFSWFGTLREIMSDEGTHF